MYHVVTHKIVNFCLEMLSQPYSESFMYKDYVYVKIIKYVAIIILLTVCQQKFWNKYFPEIIFTNSKFVSSINKSV